MSKIKETRLQEYKEYIDKIFLLNNIEFKCTYTESDNNNKNSMLSYIADGHFGIVCYIQSEDKFGGAVLNNKKLSHYEQEGFDDEHNSSEAKIYSFVDKIELFVPVLLFPKKIETYET